MLSMCAELGFKIEPDLEEPGLCHVVLDLTVANRLVRAPERVD
jgi:hypothetical protein